MAVPGDVSEEKQATDMPRFGDLLRSHRVAAGLSQEALAEQAGLSPLAVSHLERGQRRGPRRATVAALATALGLSAAQTATLEGAVQRRRRPRPARAPYPPGLPRGRTPLLGRDADLAVLPFLLGHGEMRLLTLIGPAGVGKTRLAVDVAMVAAPDFPDGVTWVDLAPIGTPALVAPTIATRLGVPADRASDPAGLIALLQGHFLLVLDNLEQLVFAAPLLQDLLDACPALRILATSRVPLGLRGERPYAISPLALPPPGAEDPQAVGSYASVTLFLTRARTLVPDLILTHATAATIAAICRRLDGLPLAIELAAALVRLVPPNVMLARLDASSPAAQSDDEHPGAATLDLLEGGSWDRPDRQQTMRSALTWSYELLSPREQTAFRRLGVFAGGCTTAAASAVLDVAADTMPLMLAALCAQQLVRSAEPESSDRFGMLETVRAYATELLADAEQEVVATRTRHLHWCLGLTETAEPQLKGPQQGAWLARLEREHDNMRAALQWATRGGEADLGLRLAGTLTRFWHMRGYMSEGRTWLERLLALPVSAADQARDGRARALSGAALLAGAQGDYAQAVTRAGECLVLCRELQDDAGMIGALNVLANVEQLQGHTQEATRVREEHIALCRAQEDQAGLRVGLHNLGHLVQGQGAYARAAALFEESLTLQRADGATFLLAGTLSSLGSVLHMLGDLGRAAALAEEGLALARAQGDRWWTAYALMILGGVVSAQREHARARSLLDESVDLNRQLDNRSGLAAALCYAGRAAWRAGDAARAAGLYGESLTRFQLRSGEHREIAQVLTGLAAVAQQTGAAARAARILGSAASVLAGAPGIALPPDEQVMGKQTMAGVHEALGSTAATAAWATGKGLTPEQCVLAALE